MSPLNPDEIVYLEDDTALAGGEDSDLLPDPMTDGVEVTELDSANVETFTEFDTK